MGATHVNALSSSLNIPPVHGDTLKAREREIGPPSRTLLTHPVNVC